METEIIKRPLLFKSVLCPLVITLPFQETYADEAGLHLRVCLQFGVTKSVLQSAVYLVTMGPKLSGFPFNSLFL